MRRRRIYEAYAEAAVDRVFLEDMRRVSEAFDPAVGEGLADVGE
jgi:hypothetical protein